MSVKPGALAILLLLVLSPFEAHALVWPDVPERVERGLRSTDLTARRQAARELTTLGRERAEPLILRALEDADLDVRLAAAQAAMSLRLPSAAEVVLAWLGDREPRARLAACELAKAAPSPRAVPQLARALGDADPQVRAAAADALGSHGSEDAVAPLLGKLDDPSPPVRVQLARALARLGDRRAVVPLVGKVQDSVPEVRQAVVRSLGALGDPRATQALVIALRDANNDVRVEALAALGTLRGDAAVNAIASLLGDRTTVVRQAAFSALGRIASPAAVSALLALVGLGEDAAVTLDRTPVRDALIAAGAGGGAAESALLPLLERSPSPAAATSAAVILGELKATAAERGLVAGLRRGTVPLPAALRGLAGCGTSASVAVVLEFVADENPAARAEALKTAALLLDPEKPDGRAVEPLTAALRGGRLAPSERAAVVQLLGRTGASRAANALVPLLQAKDTTLRLAALDALAAVGPSAARAEGVSGQKGPEAALDECLDDRSAEVRLHAGMALARVGGALARELLFKRLESSDETDRFAVLHALGGIMARAPSEAAVGRLERALELAPGPERDALIEVLASVPLASASALVVAQARGAASDRSTAVAALAVRARTSRPAAEALVAALADPLAEVRAQAAWAVGTQGNTAALPALAALATHADAALATNATAAVGRLAAAVKRGGGTPGAAGAVLCARVTDTRGYVRTNALVGLAEIGLTCPDGARVRKVLAEDPSEDARLAAVALVRGTSGPEDRAALERCASQERSGAVAARCREALTTGGPARTAPPASLRPSAVTVYVGQEGSAVPRPLAPYALRYTNGYIRAGVADRRGAVVDPEAPSGWVELRKPLGAR